MGIGQAAGKLSRNLLRNAVQVSGIDNVSMALTSCFGVEPVHRLPGALLIIVRICVEPTIEEMLNRG